MNIAKAFELAIAETLREHAEVGQATTIRAYQSLAADARYKAGEQGDRQFPCIDIRCSPPRLGSETLAHRVIDAEIVIMTHANDDQDHGHISEIYTSVQDTLDDLLEDASEFNETALLATFLEAFAPSGYGVETICGGALRLGDGSLPSVDSSINNISMGLELNYTHCRRKNNG
jgi:hypothetical protein